MGKVWRAHHTGLNRDDALKVLPEAFASDPDRLARFRREAQVLASLNHPNIAHVYGLEQVDGVQALVMELVEGLTLADRIAQGPIPVDEALPIAKQIAEALEAADEQGIIHRDLKPANIKVRADGTVKVLDFGLAKLAEPNGVSTTNPAALSMSPTITSPALISGVGVLFGTAAYMAPEQAKGRPADRRSDLWAFGCVLFETLTGTRPFEGEDVTDVLVAVLSKEPNWTKLPPGIPPAIRRLLRRCLERDRKRRLDSAADAKLEIDEALAPSPGHELTTTGAKVDARSAGSGRALPWALLGIALVALAVVLALWAPWRATPPADPLRLGSELGTDASLAANLQGNSTLALSPDGRTLAFIGEKNGAVQIYVRRLGQLQASPLAGTSGAQSPFFSPDGLWLAFFADGKLKKISVTGGAAVTLADAAAGRGGSWGDDGNIVFTPNTARTNLQRLSSAGGKVEPVVKPASGEFQRWPQVLPGARAVLYGSAASGAGVADGDIAIQPLPYGTPRVVVQGGYHPQYVPGGHLLYIHDGTLFAAPFDLNRLEVTGQAVPAVEGVSTQPDNGAAQFAVSQTGALAYLAGQSTGVLDSVVWMNQDGKTSPLRAMPSVWTSPRFSPDGRRLALDILERSNDDVWVYEWARDTLTRLTFDPASDRNPVWTPDGKRIVFESERAKGPYNLYWQPADGTGEVQRLTESPNNQNPTSFHPSGKYLAFWESTPQHSFDLMILPIEGDEKSGWRPGKPSVFLSTAAAEQNPMFSPDGRWIAYQSNESGRYEIFVRPFPGPGGKWQISSGGGTAATWSRMRHELLYLAPDNRIMAASYTIEGDSLRADKPRVWSEQAIHPRPGTGLYFDLHPDGQRVAVAIPPNQSEEKLDHVTFIFNFFDELRRIAPATR